MCISSKGLWTAGLTAGVSILSLAAPATAQTAQAGSEQALRETSTADIVVTAARRTQSLQDVPMSVDVATGEELQRLNIFDAKDVQQLSPGLQLTNTGGRNNTATLRGISFDPDQGTSPAVDLYFNEFPIDAQTAFTAIYDIDQIEVLRGPQGALRGRTAPAGAITIRTRRPNLDHVEGYIQATGTEDHAFNVQGGVTLPIVPGKLSMRVAMLADGNRLNQVYNINLGRWSRSRTLSGRLSLAWQPSEDLNVNFSYQYLHSDTYQNRQVFGTGNAPSLVPFGDPTTSGPAIAVDDYLAVHEGLNRYLNESHLLNLAVDWDLGPVTMSFVGGHQHTVLDQYNELDAGNAIPGYTNVQRNRTPYPVTMGELRLISNNDGFWNWTLGAYYYKQGGDVTSVQKANTFFANAPIGYGLYLPIVSDTFVPINNRTIAFSASSRFAFTDKLTLEVAARYSLIKVIQNSTAVVTSPGFPGLFGIPAIPGFERTIALVRPDLAVTKEHPLTGAATLTYEFSPDVTAYAAYGRSFRSGSAGVGVPENISNDLVISNSEKTDSFEAGLKTSLFGRRLTMNISAFYQKFDGFLSRFPGIYYDVGARNALGVFSGPPDGIVDGQFPSGFNYNGDATVKGVEATIAGQPVRNWNFSLSASYVKSRYDNALLPCNDFNGDGIPDAVGTPRITGSGNVSYCLSNGRLAEVPDFSLTANSEVSFPIRDLDLFVRGLFTYRPGFFSERVNYDYQDREMLNLYLGLRDSAAGWEFSLFARNLLNQKRITNISQGEFVQPTASTPYRSGYYVINATNPREFGLTANYNF